MWVIGAAWGLFGLLGCKSDLCVIRCPFSVGSCGISYLQELVVVCIAV